MSDAISAFLQQRVDAGDFPSAVYHVGEGDETALSGSVGKAVVEPESIDASDHTIYDLASLTKPLITGLLIAILVERGVISLDHKVSAHLGEFDIDAKRMITIRDLVSHSSHLPAWVPFYLLTDDPADVINKIAGLQLHYGSGAANYGDPNFIVLGILLERLSGKSLDHLATDEIFEPLGLKNTFFNPPMSQRPNLAANELGNEFERRMCIEKGFPNAGSYGFRHDWVWGEVHDGNAYFMNGVAGHAGLFSKSAETFMLAQQFLPSTSRLLQRQTCRLFTENLTPGENEARSLAFQLASTPQSTAGRSLSPQSFGHLGFTGTSLWIDPIAKRTYILLTNRTHRRQMPFPNINAVRRQFHDLAASEIRQ